MRSYRFLFVPAAALCVACGPQLPSAGAVAPAKCQPLPGTSESASSGALESVNDTKLVAEPLQTPNSTLALHFGAPELAEEIPLEARLAYEVRLLRETTGEEPGWIELSLDGGRPRRLSGSQSSIALGRLVAADVELGPGSHWLFAAPVLGSGLVPRPASGASRSAIARRFYIGKAGAAEPGPTGAIWLRQPQGTYNGAEAAARLLFDAFVFSATGTPLEVPVAIRLHGPSVAGALRYPSPFSVHEVPSGDYRVDVSAEGARPLAQRFVVNRELGGAP